MSLKEFSIYIIIIDIPWTELLFLQFLSFPKFFELLFLL